MPVVINFDPSCRIQYSVHSFDHILVENQSMSPGFTLSLQMLLLLVSGVKSHYSYNSRDILGLKKRGIARDITSLRGQ
jgi:hypothetical protein